MSVPVHSHSARSRCEVKVSSRRPRVPNPVKPAVATAEGRPDFALRATAAAHAATTPAQTRWRHSPLGMPSASPYNRETMRESKQEPLGDPCSGLRSQTPDGRHRKTGSAPVLAASCSSSITATRTGRSCATSTTGASISKAIDIATGYFEIGALLALEGRVAEGRQDPHPDGRRGFAAHQQGASRRGCEHIEDRLDESLEAEKEKNDSRRRPRHRRGHPRGKIQCRVYRKEKFHAKAYITHARQEVVGSFALVGSSNFTFPGITQNIELNVQITGRRSPCCRSGTRSTGTMPRT